MYVHHKGTYPVFDFDLFITIYTGAKEIPIYFPGFSLS